MTEMTPIERAARALYQQLKEDLDIHQLGEESEWPDYVDMVRAVLTALREPSEGMVEAGNRSKPYNVVGYCEGKIHAVVQRAWPAMIDAALEEMSSN